MNKVDKNCILYEACILVSYKQKLRKTYSKFYSRIKRDKYQEEKIKGQEMWEVTSVGWPGRAIQKVLFEQTNGDQKETLCHQDNSTSAAGVYKEHRSLVWLEQSK